MVHRGGNRDIRAARHSVDTIIGLSKAHHRFGTGDTTGIPPTRRDLRPLGFWGGEHGDIPLALIFIIAPAKQLPSRICQRTSVILSERDTGPDGGARGQRGDIVGNKPSTPARQFASVQAAGASTPSGDNGCGRLECRTCEVLRLHRVSRVISRVFSATAFSMLSSTRT